MHKSVQEQFRTDSYKNKDISYNHLYGELTRQKFLNKDQYKGK